MTTLGYLDAAVLGVVEGLTEFLPVSSTGHLTVTEGLLGLEVDDPAVTAFTAIIQFGAIVATFIYFRADLLRLARAWLRGIRPGGGRWQGRHGRDDGELVTASTTGTGTPSGSGASGDPATPGSAPGGRRGRRAASARPSEVTISAEDQDYRFAWLVIAGSVPIVVVGLLAKPLITGPLRSLYVVAVALIAWSAVMWWAERRPAQRYTENDLTLRQVLLIGLAQCVAVIPGVSRSGATISAGLLLGTTRVTATRLSFFLAIPALTGAGLFELKDVDTAVVGWGPLLVGMLVSFVVAYASIAWLLRLVARHPITVFVGYRVVAGVVILVLLWTGVLDAT